MQREAARMIGESTEHASEQGQRVRASGVGSSFSWVFAASLALHGLVGARLVTHHDPPPHHVVASQVEVELARPPDPAPPPEPPPPPPPPPEPAAAPPPQAAPAPLARAPVPTAAPAPLAPAGASDEGTFVAPPAAAGPATEGSTTGVPGGKGAAVAPPPPPAAPAPVVPPREGANYRNNPRPPYPRRALKEGWEGKVLLRVKVLSDGRVGGVAVQTSAGHSLLDDAAIAAVKSWTFAPAKQGDVPVEGWVTVPIDFHIQ